MDRTSKKQYWEVVRQCLRQLFRLSATQAILLTREYRRRIVENGFELVIYNDEPYECVCDIVGVNSNVPAHREQYARILDCYFPWCAAALVPSRLRVAARERGPSKPTTRRNVAG